MSSELIGELGKVGLTIGEPVAQQTTEDDENAHADEGMSDDSANDGASIVTGTKRSRGSTNSRPKKFRTAWMMFDIFKDWLRPHEDPQLATCIVCERVIKAGKSELEKHATGKRHLKMLKEQQQQGIGIIISGGGDSGADMETYSLHGGFEQPYKGGSKARRTPAGEFRRVKGSSKRRLQRYRPAWEDMPEFALWLAAHPDPYKAICQVCDKVITADLAVIRSHAISKKHLLAEQSFLKTRQRILQSSHKSSPPRKSAKSDGGDCVGSGDPEDTMAAGEGSCNEKQFVMYREIDQQYASDAHTAAVDDSYTSGGVYLPAQLSAHNRNSLEPNRDKLFVTNKAPHWRATAIVNGHITRLDMNDYKGRYVVLFFYSHNFSKVDASEINRLSDRIADFRSVQTEIVACSTDSHLSHLAWVKKNRGEGGVSGVKIPLIADPTHVISKDYGVYIQSKGHNLRAHFIIDRRGILRHMAINDPLIGRGTDEILRIVKALQFSDQIEEPLVADWAPEA